jgi:hypothetical protein
VDRFSRYGLFIPLAHPYTAAMAASLFVNHIYKLHGLPQTIVYDRDLVFISQFWQELFRAIGSELKMSTLYHPATAERLRVCLFGLLLLKSSSSWWAIRKQLWEAAAGS